MVTPAFPSFSAMSWKFISACDPFALLSLSAHFGRGRGLVFISACHLPLSPSLCLSVFGLRFSVFVYPCLCLSPSFSVDVFLSVFVTSDLLTLHPQGGTPGLKLPLAETTKHSCLMLAFDVGWTPTNQIQGHRSDSSPFFLLPGGHLCSLQVEGHLPLPPGNGRLAREALSRMKHSRPAMVWPRTASLFQLGQASGARFTHLGSRVAGCPAYHSLLIGAWAWRGVGSGGK